MLIYLRSSSNEWMSDIGRASDIEMYYDNSNQSIHLIYCYCRNLNVTYAHLIHNLNLNMANAQSAHLTSVSKGLMKRNKETW